MTVLAASQIRLTPEQVGMARIDESPAGCVEIINELLQKNHDEFDMFWRPAAGHNHTVHSVLSVYALGGGPEDIRRAFEDDDLHQEPLLTVDRQLLGQLRDAQVFRDHMQQLKYYATYLRFFEQEIEAKGWQETVTEYCFSETPLAETMFCQLFEGAYHPLIHLGFGIEFEQPCIIAEGLAQAATHDPANIEEFLARSRDVAKSGRTPSRPLKDLYHDVHANEKIRFAAKMEQGPVRIRDGVMANAMDEIVAVAAQFQVSPDNLEKGLVEMVSGAAYGAGAAQRKGKSAKIDFFLMHNITCSIFLNLLLQQNWISATNKGRLVEWKARMDLVWYASCSAPHLDIDLLDHYQPTLSKKMTWRTLYRATTKVHDDGHLSKFVRALKSAEEVSRPFENDATLPVRGDTWFRLAQMGYDSTYGLPDSAKWIMGAGYDFLWTKVPDLQPVQA